MIAPRSIGAMGLLLALAGCAFQSPVDDLTIRTPGTWVAASSGNEGRISTGWLSSFSDPVLKRSVNEALAHGVPAVVSDQVGCAPDLIQDGTTGAVFAAGDADSLAIALRRVLPLLNNGAALARCREIVSVYSVANAARGIAAAFNRVARR